MDNNYFSRGLWGLLAVFKLVFEQHIEALKLIRDRLPSLLEYLANSVLMCVMFMIIPYSTFILVSILFFILFGADLERYLELFTEFTPKYFYSGHFCGFKAINIWVALLFFCGIINLRNCN